MQTVLEIRLTNLRHDVSGFSQIGNVFNQVINAPKGSRIKFQMRGVTWLDADMCAPLHAALEEARSQRSLTYEFVDFAAPVQNILRKNGFLSMFGFERLTDTYQTTIPHRRFQAEETKAFDTYIMEHVLSRSELPSLSPGLQYRLRQNFTEAFQNSVEHAQSAVGIYCCGQWFPRRNRLNFAVVDAGIGIGANVRSHLDLPLPGPSAINWAVKKGATTRSSVGGFGLHLLTEFAKYNGRLSIISHEGHWSLAAGNANPAGITLTSPFPGTAILVEIDTADTREYSLVGEYDRDELF